MIDGKRKRGKNGFTIAIIAVMVMMGLFCVGRAFPEVFEPLMKTRPQVAASTSTEIISVATSTPKPVAVRPSSEQVKLNVDVFAINPYNGESIPMYYGEPYISIHDNLPFFGWEDLEGEVFEEYGTLDSLGRCTTCVTRVGRELMPSEERGDINEITPSGWMQAKYDSIEGGYLYNRCHLIGYQLTGEDDNERNLVTGTRYLNVEGMLPFENVLADYIKDTKNHVLYRVTPVYVNDELVPRGVLLEAMSIEDQADGILFNVFVYNVQPGIAINYANGDSYDMGMGPANEDETASPKPTKYIYVPPVIIEEASWDPYFVKRTLGVWAA